MTTPYVPIRRASTQKSLDRATWADVTAKPYVSRVYGGGEYLTRDVFFDRAFDGPPILDWDMTIIDGWAVSPHATVGIANWIIDEFDAYIGCRIWIKIKCDFCPPVETCLEPLIYAENLLRDPGFENHLSWTGGGPTGDAIPMSSDTHSSFTECKSGLAWPDGGTDFNTWPCAVELPLQNQSNWCSIDGDAEDHWWKVSDADPLAGQYHARWTKGPATNNAPSLTPFQQGTCVGSHVYSCRVFAGDTVNFSYNIKASTLTGGPTSNVFITWVGTQYLFFGEFAEVNNVPMATSYQEVAISGQAPSWALYALIEIDPSPGGGFPVGAFIDIDECQLEVVKWSP